MIPCMNTNPSWVNTIVEFVKEFVPNAEEKLEHYPGERPLFELYNIEDDLQKALSRKVALKSGGYLIIDQTEAMTTIDVNTGNCCGDVRGTKNKATHGAATSADPNIQILSRQHNGAVDLQFIGDLKMSSARHLEYITREVE